MVYGEATTALVEPFNIVISNTILAIQALSENLFI
jgi:hypothetical protein